MDPFFVDAAQEGKEALGEPEAHEKRAVMRDGRVPKFKKNLEKM